VRSANRQTLRVAAVALLVVLAAGIAQTAFGKSVLEDARVTGGEERFTELALVSPQRLADQVHDARSEVRLPFRVHNAEGQAREYRWTVLVHAGEHTSVAGRGRIGLAHGTSDTVDKRFTVRCTGKRVRVEVRLDRPSRSVSAWFRCRDTPPEEYDRG
jgi:hypothetical protein